MDNIIIATSSDLYDQMQQQMQQDSAIILAQNKRIGQLEVQCLKGSIQLTGANRHISELKAEVAQQDVVILRLKEIAFQHCEMFEQIFESSEDSFTYEKMREYLDVAEYMQSKFGRTSRYIRRVKERIKKLPF